MLTILKKSERSLKSNEMIRMFKQLGYSIKNLGEYDKWKDLSDGGRLQVKITVYKITDTEGKIFYMMVDTLGRIMNQFTQDKNEVFDWLKEKGYKPEKQWYLEDYGMSEETWNAWNGKEQEEE